MVAVLTDTSLSIRTEYKLYVSFHPPAYLSACLTKYVVQVIVPKVGTHLLKKCARLNETRRRYITVFIKADNERYPKPYDPNSHFRFLFLVIIVTVSSSVQLGRGNPHSYGKELRKVHRA
jgi:hypothetical protein